jgi:Putative peptidoglycan binding domain
MKTTKLISLAITALVAFASTAWAGPHGGGGGGHFGGGGFGGGHVGGGFGGGQFGGFGGARVGSFNGGGIRAAPAFSGGGARFSGNRSIGGMSRAPQQFSYYTGARTSAVVPRASARQLPNRSMNSTTGRVVPVNRQSNRVNSAVGHNRVTNARLSTAGNRQAFVKNHAFARHDSNWHRDWDKHRAHFDHNRVFVFVGGSWWGLYPWDYYPYYGYGNYPYDYSYDYPYDYSGYPYDGADYSSSQPYGYYNGYAPSGQYSNSVVSAVQSKLASLGYYHGAIDGILGDESEAALARYQQDQDLSVTGTVTSATLQALDLPYSGL